MRSLPCYIFFLLLIFTATSACTAQSVVEESPLSELPATYLLAAKLEENDTAKVIVKLEVGGDLQMIENAETKSWPLNAEGELSYVEQIVAWSADSDNAARSLRRYENATAKIQIDDAGIQRGLPEDRRLIVAEVRDSRATLAGAVGPLTYNEFDLINVVGNSLVINRLLPQRELAEGESWKHGASVMQALLGMDHVAVCEVSSIAVDSKNRQVRIRLAGTVHGTVDGAPTEMELRGAYLFHLDHERITKFNLAIQEKRTPNQVLPGLDTVAKVYVTMLPSKSKTTSQPLVGFADTSRDMTQPLVDTLLYRSTQADYQFSHNRDWYITDEQRSSLSLKSIHQGDMTAHCNVTTLPARSVGRETSLAAFQEDVRLALGDNLQSIAKSTEWTTAQGHHCLGVVATGTIEEVPIEWRYYLVSSPNKPRISLSITIDQAQVKKFNNADRQLIDSLELFEKSTTATKPAKHATR